MASPQEPLSTGAISKDTATSSLESDIASSAAQEAVTPSTPTTSESDRESSHKNTRDSDPESDTCRCFVCIDDVPANQLPRDWVTPCHCSIQGHQDCLLDWVADLESQNKPVVCPQCKSVIRTTERWDPVVKFGDALTNFMSSCSPTILLGMLGIGTTVASGFYGLEVLQIFAGDEFAQEFVLRDIPTSPLPAFVQDWFDQWFPHISSYTIQHIPDLRLGNVCLLPLVGPVLILNRLNLAGVWIVPSSVAVGLPIATAVLNFSEGHQHLVLTRLLSQTLGWSFYRQYDGLDTAALAFYRQSDDIPFGGPIWPPTFDQALTLFPLLKMAYFHTYEKLAGSIEARLEAKIKRYTLLRDNDDDTAGPNGAQNALNEQIEALERAEERDGGEDEARGEARQNQRRAVLDTYPFNFVVGALLYPFVSYGAGEVLRTLLPKWLVTRPGAVATGLLQEQWGRSFVGGCLFVALKDAFFLYVKYRRALNRPYRRVRNVDRRR